MALPDIQFKTLDGGLGRTLAGDDATSALVVDASNQPAGVAKTIVVYSLQEAVAKGIVASGATAEANYHITQFFKQIAAPLYVTFSQGDLTQDFDDLQNEAQGAIKQVAVADNSPFLTSTLAAIQTAIDAQKEDHRGCSALYATSDMGTYTLATLPDLSTMALANVSVVISKDAASRFTGVACTLATLASSKVSENIGAVEKFNVAKDTEFDVLGFTTGDAYKAVSKAQRDQLNSRKYIFLRKYTGRAGSFHNNSYTANLATSDFARIENTRTMEKAQRQLRYALEPKILSNLATKSKKLSPSTVASFELVCENALEAMQNAGEISEYSIYIDPTQNVLATSALTIDIGITPLGVAEQIKVNIGFEV